MLWTLLLAAVLALLGLNLLLGLVVWLLRIPERRRERASQQFWKHWRAQVQAERATNPLARLRPGVCWEDIPCTVRWQAESQPWIPISAQAPERTARVRRWRDLREAYGYLPAKVHLRVRPTLHRV